MADLSRLNYDGRRLETRARELIAHTGLEDSYGETGGLIAAYDPDSRVMTIQDEAVKARWRPRDGHFFTAAQWAEMACFIRSCTEEGCPELHQHSDGEEVSCG